MTAEIAMGPGCCTGRSSSRGGPRQDGPIADSTVEPPFRGCRGGAAAVATDRSLWRFGRGGGPRWGMLVAFVALGSTAIVTTLALLPAGNGKEQPPAARRLHRYAFAPIASTDEAFAATHPLTVAAEAPLRAQRTLLAELDQREGTPAIGGRGSWRTTVVAQPGVDVETAAARGQSYATLGPTVPLLTLRLGIGRRGTYLGNVVASGGERAMLELRIHDPESPGTRFRIAVHADDGRGGRPPVEVTPNWLARPVAAGRYRIPVQVADGGSRFLVGVRTVAPTGEEIAWTWASPIGVRRPW